MRLTHFKAILDEGGEYPSMYVPMVVVVVELVVVAVEVVVVEK